MSFSNADTLCELANEVMLRFGGWCAVCGEREASFIQTKHFCQPEDAGPMDFAPLCPRCNDRYLGL